jgi:hypothetical protein
MHESIGCYALNMINFKSRSGMNNQSTSNSKRKIKTEKKMEKQAKSYRS